MQISRDYRNHVNSCLKRQEGIIFKMGGDRRNQGAELRKMYTRQQV